MSRHIFLIPGFFGFANLGDFTYWGHVQRTLEKLLPEAELPATIHCVKSLPTASLRARTRCLLETIAAAKPGKNAVIHLVGHSTGGLDARLLLTPNGNLGSALDQEACAARVRSAVSIATPHRGAPIASFFTGILGRQLLRLLSVVTMTTLRRGHLPLAVWAEVAGLFALPKSFGGATGTLATQLNQQLLSDFNVERRAQVNELLAEVERDQSLLTQLTVEAMDLFNAAAGDRAGVCYGSVVTRAPHPSLETALDVGFNTVNQAQLAIYYTLDKLAGGYEFPAPSENYRKALDTIFGDHTDPGDSDGIVPTLSQPWGSCVAVAQADHLDIIGHYDDSDDVEPHYDWLTTHSNFKSDNFRATWARVVAFMAAAERP